jgi:AAA+ ATPase superfamily predicted ATPase
MYLMYGSYRELKGDTMKKSDDLFVGRDYELQLLRELFNKSYASMVICRGRRRIGKSTLIQKFGEYADVFIQFQGLPPRKDMTFRDQLQAFSEQLSRQTAMPQVGIDSWDKAFFLLGGQLKKKKTVILFDEISWMADDAPDFAGYLKIAWDTLFSKFSKLVLVVCGSVSSWIDINILNNTGFVGRVTSTLTLEQLPLYFCNKFWGTSMDRISSHEKLQFLAISGGVPRYLTEILPSENTMNTIRRLCFSANGLLFKDFNQIFHDIFSKRSETYRTIVETLAEGPRSQNQIANMLEKMRSGYLGSCLEDLELSGFIRKFPCAPLGHIGKSRIHQYRIIDNYLRFYLKYIAPIAENIKQGLYKKADLNTIIAWDTILGIQFETLIINNIPSVLCLLQIEPGTVLRAGPYFQRKTNRSLACQIDLLIVTKHTIFVGEIKCRSTIGIEIVREIKEKIERLRPPPGKSIRPFLVYEGSISSDIVKDQYFDRIISLSDLMVTNPD